MPWPDEDTAHDHTLTPIGDEVELRSHPLEVAQPSKMDSVRRRAAKVKRLIPKPKNRVEQVACGLVYFAIIVAGVAGLAYGLGLFVEDHSGLTHNLALLTVFLVVGAAVAAPPLVLPFFSAIPARMYRFRRSDEPSVDDEDGDDLPEYGMWQLHWAFWGALGISLLTMGFAVWGRGTQEKDSYLADLAELVAPDWGKQSATCQRYQGRLSLCTVQGAQESDRFEVCVTWRLTPRPTLTYSPVRKCGVDAPGLTKPLLHRERYRASATAACLRQQPGYVPQLPLGTTKSHQIFVRPIRPIHRLSDGTVLVVEFHPPHGFPSRAEASFLQDKAKADRWYQYLHRVLPIPKSLDDKALYRRRNVVVEWANPVPAYASRLDACLRT